MTHPRLLGHTSRVFIGITTIVLAGSLTIAYAAYRITRAVALDDEPTPYLVLRIRKPAGMTDEPSFVLNTGTQIVPQLCAISGEYVPWEPIASKSDAYSPRAELSPSLAIVQTLDEAPPDQPLSYYSPSTGINLRTRFGMVAYQGEQPTTEHGIDVISVKRQDETILVCAQFILFWKGPPDVVYPYYVFQVERTSELKGKQTFILLDDGVEVARKVAVIS